MCPISSINPPFNLRTINIVKNRKNKIGRILTTLSFAFLVLGCNQIDTLETDPELVPYFQIFADEAAVRGIEVDFVEANIEGLLQDIGRNEVLGQCFRNEQRPRKVIIDRGYWERDDVTEEDRQFLIFHELGHCFLDLEHDDRIDSETNTCVSIMHSTLDVCPFMFNDDTRVRYLDELFTK